MEWKKDNQDIDLIQLGLCGLGYTGHASITCPNLGHDNPSMDRQKTHIALGFSKSPSVKVSLIYLIYDYYVIHYTNKINGQYI